MRRLSWFAVLALAAACGSDNKPSGGGSSDPCTAFVTAVNAKAATCSLTVSSAYLPACQTAIASCSADDKTKINNITNCINSVQACTTASAFETAGDNCVNTTAPTLSTACQSAMTTAANSLNLVPTGGGGGTFTPGSGSCNITVSGQTVACEEFSSAIPASALQAACVPANCGGTVSGSSCAFSSGQCTATGRLGRCIYTSSSVTFQLSWYGTGGTTAAQAQQACTAAGGSGVTTQWIAN